MTPDSSAFNPDSNSALYISSVLSLYFDLPDTPLRASTHDQRQVRTWFDRSVPLAVVETALLLGTLRRRVRPTDRPPLPRIRSVAYFQPILEELLENPAPPTYLQYLRLKYRTLVDKADPAAVQKTTFSGDC